MSRKCVIAVALSLALLSVAWSIQSNVFVERHNWSITIPDPGCGEDCVDRIRIGEDGTIFVLRNSEFLYVSENNVDFDFFDLSQALPIGGVRRDFVPLGSNGELLFFDYQAISNETTMFNWKTEVANPVNLDIDGTLIECSAISNLIPVRSILNIGASSAGVCSQDEGIGYVNIISHINNSLSSSSVEVGRLPELNRRPWEYIAGGQDDNVYIVPSGLTTISLVPDLNEGISPVVSTVLQYSTMTTSWELLDLEMYPIRWNTEDLPLLVDFVGVDTDGNLYFHYVGRRLDGLRGFDLVKYDSDGLLLWKIDETHTNGDLITDLILISENRLLFPTTNSILDTLFIPETDAGSDYSIIDGIDRR